MGIQQVGGAKVYVITGSNRDPRLTSTGQSWANLVTQQKYRLWQEAQRQAMLEMNYEQKTAAEQQAIQEALKGELRKNIAASDEAVLKLQQEEAKSIQAIKEMQAKEQNLRGRSKTISSGGATKDPTFQIEKDLRLRKERARDSIFQRQKYISGLKEDLSGLVDPNTNEPYAGDETRAADLSKQIKEQEAAITALNTSITSATTAEDNLKKMKEEGRVPLQTSGSRTYQTREKPIVTPEAISYAPQIAELQAQRQAYEEQLAGLETAQTTAPDLIGRTRDVYQREFGGPLFQRREKLPPTTVTPYRQAEMDILGLPSPQQEAPAVEQPTPQEAPVEEVEFKPSTVEQTEAKASFISPNEYVQQYYYSKIKDKNLNDTGKRAAIMEAVVTLPEVVSKNTQEYTDTLSALTKAWQEELSPKDAKVVSTGMDKARRAEKIPQTEMGKLVGSLYSPSRDMKQEDVQAMFDNAKKELQKEYRGEKLDKALEILVQLHTLYTEQ
jgi:hypothetical protein